MENNHIHTIIFTSFSTPIYTHIHIRTHTYAHTHTRTPRAYIYININCVQKVLYYSILCSVYVCINCKCIRMKY